MWCQPFTVIIFLVSGILSFLTGAKLQGTINMCFAITNVFIFYGDRFLN